MAKTYIQVRADEYKEHTFRSENESSMHKRRNDFRSAGNYGNGELQKEAARTRIKR